jgi:Holliday junction resolvase RusA-like endonuclease
VKPQVKQRPRLGRRRKAYTPEATTIFEKFIRMWWDRAHGTDGRSQINGPPVAVEITVGKDWIDVDVIEMPERTRPVGVLGDADNYIKSILDGLQASIEHYGAFFDDRQVERIVFEFSQEEAA